MPQTMMVRLSETIASGRLKLAAFRYWLTRKRRWNAIGENPLCKGFCPMCKYADVCESTLKILEEL